MRAEKVIQTQTLYGKPEELTNTIMHAAGAALSFVGLVFLMLKVTAQGYSPLAVFAVLVYGVCSIAAFAVGALYHLMPIGSSARDTLGRFDHCTVAVLVLGAFSPVMLMGIGSAWGYALFSIIATSAICAVIINAVDAAKLKVFSLIVYVIMGCACLVRADAILSLCGFECFWFMLGGAIVYALGVVFYAVKRIPMGHTIWHLLSVAGAALQFVGIYLFLV